MLSYETLDLVADSYTPALALLSLATIGIPVLSKELHMTGKRLLLCLSLVAIAYAGMFLERSMALWERMGLDYSTHTAVAIALSIFLCICAKRLAPLWVGALLLYVALMLYQRYHTLADIASTAAALLPVMTVVTLLFCKRWPELSAAPSDSSC